MELGVRENQDYLETGEGEGEQRRREGDERVSAVEKSKD